MLFSYVDCEKRFGNHYQVKKMVDEGKLYKVEKGVYSDVANVSELEVISYKYGDAVFTMNSAFYYHGLTDVIPGKYYLATRKNAYRISDKKVKQHFHREDKFYIGITTVKHQNTEIKIYDMERMLIELIRNRKALPFDYYKEIIDSYRNRIHEMDIERLQEYLSAFSNGDSITESIQLEVF